MVAHVDCLGCGCLVRSKESSCPFCGASQRHTAAPLSRLTMGLTMGLGLGLGLGLSGCGDKEGDSASDTANDGETWEADAVTYGGPDSWGETSPAQTTDGSATEGTTLPPPDSDSWDADAVTYGGPDESTSIGDTPDTETGTTATDTGATDSVTGSGTDSIGTSGTTG